MKTLLVSILTLSTITGFAINRGNSSEDPVVKRLREQFQQAKAPAADALLGKVWSCKQYVAVTGDFHVNTLGATYAFREEVGIFSNSQDHYSIENYVLEAGSLHGASQEGWADYIRQVSPDLLVAELVTAGSVKGEPAVSDSAKTVFSYQVCKPTTAVFFEEGKYEPDNMNWDRAFLAYNSKEVGRISFSFDTPKDNVTFFCAADGTFCSADSGRYRIKFIDSSTIFLTIHVSSSKTLSMNYRRN